jgi:hypothetical protein
MRVHERKRGVIADGTDIAEMVGEALEFSHQGAQVDRAWRRLNFVRRFHGVGKSKRVGHGAVA